MCLMLCPKSPMHTLYFNPMFASGPFAENAAAAVAGGGRPCGDRWATPTATRSHPASTANSAEGTLFRR